MITQGTNLSNLPVWAPVCLWVSEVTGGLESSVPVAGQIECPRPIAEIQCVCMSVSVCMSVHMHVQRIAWGFVRVREGGLYQDAAWGCRPQGFIHPGLLVASLFT